MPPILAWTLAALGAAALVRFVMMQSRRANDDLDALRAEKAAEPVEREQMPRLRRDPATGEYRPD
jgi:hypothetical protein